MQYPIIFICNELLKQGQGISGKKYLATAESAPTQDQAASISHHANAGRLTASPVQPTSVQASQDLKIENENEYLGVILRVIMYILLTTYLNFILKFVTSSVLSVSFAVFLAGSEIPRQTHVQHTCKTRSEKTWVVLYSQHQRLAQRVRVHCRPHPAQT